MKTMQSVILAEIEKVIDAAGLSAVQKAEYANTGTVYAMRGMRTAAAVRYDFQDERCRLALSPDGDRRGERAESFRYSEGERLESFMQTMRACL